MELRSAASAAVLGLALGWASGCRPDAKEPLGPADSYLLWKPKEPRVTTPLLVVEKLEPTAKEAEPLPRLLSDGFAAEMLRTVYLAKQFVRDAAAGDRRFPATGRTAAADAVYIVIGEDRLPYGRGLAIGGWIGAPQERPDVTWLGFPAKLGEDKALVQTVTSRLATYALHLVTTGGTFSAADEGAGPLADGYRMAMEVIAREWRVRSGPEGGVPVTAGTEAQRALFADIRENRFVLPRPGEPARPAPDLLGDKGVAATVIYRLAQTKGIAQRAAPASFYTPFVTGRVPEGVSPAAVLGAFRNFQAKLLGAWGSAVLDGKPPKDIAGLVELYGAKFPAERAEAVRIFVVTTFGATVKPGGTSTRVQDSTRALAELDALTADVVAGRRSLRDALPAAP